MTKRPHRSEDGTYHINGKRFKELFGSRQQVMNGTAYKTAGELCKSDLMMNKWGRIVSRKKHATAKREKRLVKHGYTAKKGKFGYVKMDKKKSRKNGRKSSRKMRGGGKGDGDGDGDKTEDPNATTDNKDPTITKDPNDKTDYRTEQEKYIEKTNKLLAEHANADKNSDEERQGKPSNESDENP